MIKKSSHDLMTTKAKLKGRDPFTALKIHARDQWAKIQNLRPVFEVSYS